MKEAKFRNMEKRIAELESEISALKTQLLSLALSLSPFIPKLPPIQPQPWQPFISPTVNPVGPTFIGTGNRQDDGHAFTVKC